MKSTEIKDLTDIELKEKLVSEKENLRKMQFAHQVSAIENPMKIRDTRRLIARLHTVLRQKATQK